MQGFAQWLQATQLSVAIQSSEWLIPLLQSIHILTIGVVFVSSSIVMLRVLGRMRTDEAFDAVWSRFAPWTRYGVVVMTLTGVVLIVGEPERELGAISFWVKLALLAVAIVGTLRLGHALKAAPAAPFSNAAKIGAAALIVLWIAIIFFGRAIAYDTEVWGALAQQA